MQFSSHIIHHTPNRPKKRKKNFQSRIHIIDHSASHNSTVYGIFYLLLLQNSTRGNVAGVASDSCGAIHRAVAQQTYSS